MFKKPGLKRPFLLWGNAWGKTGEAGVRRANEDAARLAERRF